MVLDRALAFAGDDQDFFDAGRDGFLDDELDGRLMSASSRIEQLTPINFEHFRSQTCSGDASYGSWLHSCERPPLDAEYGLG